MAIENHETILVNFQLQCKRRPKNARSMLLCIQKVVYVQQSISALIALSHAKKRVQNTGLHHQHSFFYFFPILDLKKNCPKDTLKMLHLCKCHETNVVDLWPLEGWVCPVSLTDRERMVKLPNAMKHPETLGGPLKFSFLWSNFLFFSRKKIT